MEYPPGRVVEGVVAQLLREGRRGEMTGQELAMLLWGCAKLGVRPMALLDAVASELAGRLAAGGEVALLHGVGREWATYAMRRPQQLDDCDRVLASCVWAYGKLNHHPGSLLAAAADAAAPRVPLMAPKELARMVWGFAKLGSAPPRFLAALGEQLGDPARLRLFRPIQARAPRLAPATGLCRCACKCAALNPPLPSSPYPPIPCHCAGTCRSPSSCGRCRCWSTS